MNYSDFSNSTKTHQIPEQPSTKVESDPVPDQQSKGAEDKLDPSKPREPIMAVVANCSRLNVRKAPSKSSQVLLVVNASDNLLVESVDEDDVWAHVYTSSGIEGYVMVEYLKPESAE